jgi:Ca2+-transporting ATPase
MSAVAARRRQDLSVDTAPRTGPWHAWERDEVARALETDPQLGLRESEAARRWQQYGPNRLQTEARRSWLSITLNQFRDVVVLVLLAAVAISLALGEVTDAAVIVAIVLLNAALGATQELRARKSLEALRQLISPHVRVIRDGKALALPSEQIVPGDLLEVEAGDLVAADSRLVEDQALRVSEGALTGEAAPVVKRADAALSPETPLSDQVNMLFSGTAIAAGRGRALVVATGAASHLGQIVTLVGGIEEEQTPLQRRLGDLARAMAWAALAICGLIFAAGALRGVPMGLMFLTAVSLAVAAIPEGLPAIVTIILAAGVQVMVRRHVIVRRLSAVETLGAVTVICTDKTGTLTQAAMTARRVYTSAGTGTLPGRTAPGSRLRAPTRGAPTDGEGPAFVGLEAGSREPGAAATAVPEVLCLLVAGALCNDAEIVGDDAGWQVRGDPTEAALLTAAQEAGVSLEQLRGEQPRVREYPFTAERKRMSTLHAGTHGIRLVVKGAPETVLPCCRRWYAADGERPLGAADRDRSEAAARQFAEEGLRVLALAFRDLPSVPGTGDGEELEIDLTLVGLVGLLDPPREEAQAAIRACRQAGIRPVMITGDHLATALAIARDLEIADGAAGVMTGDQLQSLTSEELDRVVAGTSVFARALPVDKLRIVEALQRGGDMAAVTGDGVNDAPALKRAYIGVAMGVTGTEAAKDAADMVLTDEDFASIVAAVEEGRGIFENIRKVVFYLLSCNVAEVATLFVALLAGLPGALTPVQILWINLVTDGLPALALGTDPRAADVMRRPPRDPRERVLDRGTVRDIAWYGTWITLASLAAYLVALGWYPATPARARTMLFATLALGQLSHAFNCRSRDRSLFRIGVATNPRLVAAALVSALAVGVAIFVPALRPFFDTAPLGLRDAGLVCGLAITPWLFGEALKAGRRRLPVEPSARRMTSRFRRR